MAKVFVLTTGEYSDYRVVAVALNFDDVTQYILDDYDYETGYSKRGRYADEIDVLEMETI